jgi:hypothetical protein
MYVAAVVDLPHHRIARSARLAALAKNIHPSRGGTPSAANFLRGASLRMVEDYCL